MDLNSLGDSGYFILRGDEILEFSQAQTHFFNCPVSQTSLSSPIVA